MKFLIHFETSGRNEQKILNVILYSIVDIYPVLREEQEYSAIH